MFLHLVTDVHLFHAHKCQKVILKFGLCDMTRVVEMLV